MMILDVTPVSKHDGRVDSMESNDQNMKWLEEKKGKIDTDADEREWKKVEREELWLMQLIRQHLNDPSADDHSFNQNQ